MLRDFIKILHHWKNHPLRTPLIVRGARQVGKTYAIQFFGKESFKNIITLNFEDSPIFQACFEKMEPQAIINEIELLSRTKITPGETLLFLDEIQQCPKALQSLRYFREKWPHLHLIAAGSLLEFAIHDHDFSFPVGRVQFAKLYPLSFGEYLEACGDTAIRQKLQHFDLSSPPPVAVHQHLMEQLRNYFVVGGMPAAVHAFLQSHSFLEAKYVQKALWDAFESDFGKYAKQTQHRNLRKIFNVIPRLIGDHVKYSRIDPDLPNPARDMKQAIELLRLAGLLHPIAATSAGDLPLLAGLKETIFKLLCLDIGLVEQVMDVDYQHPSLMTGPLTEQFVGQELLASSDPFLDGKLFFWTRDNGTAEVDYLIAHQGQVFPLEVKAGSSGKLKSLQLFLKEKRAPLGMKISQEPLKFEHNILSVPFYLTSQLPRLIDSILS